MSISEGRPARRNGKMDDANLSFELIPLEMAKRVAEQEGSSGAIGFVSCVVCGKPVDLGHCKTDEHGKAVHERCYLKKTTKVTTFRGRR
jgi:hypothetical protein